MKSEQAKESRSYYEVQNQLPEAKNPSQNEHAKFNIDTEKINKQSEEKSQGSGDSVRAGMQRFLKKRAAKSPMARDSYVSAISKQVQVI